MIRIDHHKSTTLKTLAAAVGILCTVAPLLASAAWQSPYLGGFLGGAFATSTLNSTVSGLSDAAYFSTNTDATAVANAASATLTPDAFMAGVVFGQDWTWRKIVLGLVLDYGAFVLDADHHARGTYAGSTDTYAVTDSLNASWLFTLRGRMGYQIPWHYPSLIYFTGGMALSALETKNAFSDNSSYAGDARTSLRQDVLGWTVGAGMEWMPTPAWALFLEYLYVDLPTVSITSTIHNAQGGFGIPANSLSSDLQTQGQLTASLVKVGASYHFAQ